MNQILQTEIQKLKDQMQELHRDLTKHHSLINTDSTKEILERSVHIDEQITAQYSAMQTLRTMFEEVRMKDVIMKHSYSSCQFLLVCRNTTGKIFYCISACICSLTGM